MKPRKPTYADLERKVIELEAQMASTCAYAAKEIEKAGDTLTGSAAILTVTGLGGRVIVRPVAIRDGFSPAAIAAIKADIMRSYELATLVKPKGAA